MNFDIPYFAGKTVVYVGESRERSSFQAFATEQLGVTSFKAIDPTNDPHWKTSLNEYIDGDKSASTVVVKGPEIPGHTMSTSYTTVVRIFFDCLRQLGVKSVGITGTVGKSTTSSLIAHILKTAGMDARLCEGVGKPMLDNLTDTTHETIMIVELTSFQLVELELTPDIAVIVNLRRDHLDYHGTVEAYWESKHNIMRAMDNQQAVVYSPKDEVVLHWLAESKSRQVPIDPNETVDMSKGKLIGEHNKTNYLMAKATANLFGVNGATCLQAYANFEPVRHRLQPVRTVKGITYIDDAIGASPNATIAGIKALIHNHGPVGCVMIGGGTADYDYTELTGLLYRIGIPKLVFFPENGRMIERLLPENYTPDTFQATDMDEAVKWAHEHTPSGSICLLSTAAPVGSLWRSFEEKGSLFQQAVLALPNI